MIEFRCLYTFAIYSIYIEHSRDLKLTPIGVSADTYIAKNLN